MKLFVIGSEGFIGSHLVDYFLSKNYEVFGCDIIKPMQEKYPFVLYDDDRSTLINIFCSNTFDLCINAAGNGDVQKSFINIAADYMRNVEDSKSILEAIRIGSPSCRYIHISSAAVYGNPVVLPVDESASINPISPYGTHKYHSEQLCVEYYKRYAIQSVILRPFSIFGPGLRKQLFWDVWQKYKLDDGRIELWGDGTETRDYVYIDQFISMVDLIIHRADFKTNVFNVGSGKSYSIKEAVIALLHHVENPPEVIFRGEQRNGNPLQWQANITKLQSLGTYSTTDFHIGIKKTADWLRENG